MKIVIAGGSGFIGQKLMDLLLNAGHSIVILTRKEKKSSTKVQYVQWLTEDAAPENEIKNADAIINLAGVSINDGDGIRVTSSKFMKAEYSNRRVT